MDHGSNNQKLFSGMVNDLKDVINQAQRNSTIDIKIKTNIDDAIKKFGELNNNIAEFGKISKYFQNKDNALARFIEEWNNLVSHNNGKKISDVVDIGNNESVDVYRLATAFEALGGDISSLPKEIQEFINSMKQISKNPAFGLENMKEAFDGIADLMSKGWIEEFPSYVRGKLQIPIIQSFENVSKESKSYSDTTQQTSQQTQKSYDDMANTAEKSAERQKKALASIEDMRSRAASRKQGNTIDSDYSFRGKLGWRSDKPYIEQVDLSGDTDLEKYTNVIKELQKQQGNALTEAQRIYNDYINQINAGESATLDESALNHQLDIYNDYCDGMEYAQNALREAREKYTEELSNFTSSGEWDEDTINGLIKALKNLAIEIHEIAKAFGTIDDENEMPTLLSQLKDISGKIPEAFDVKNLDAFKQSLNVIEDKISKAFNTDKLQEFINSLNEIKTAINNIEPSQFSPTIGVSGQSTDPREWAKEYEHYISLYNKIAKQVEQISKGQYSQNDIFGAIINSSRNLGQQFNYDEDQIRDLYGLKTIQDSVDGTIEGYKAAIQRVMDYVKLLKTAMQESQGAIDLFKGIPKVLSNNSNTLNMSTLEKQVGKRVKVDTDKAAEEANEQVKGLFSTDLTGVQQSLTNIITALNTLQDILKQGFGIKDEEGTIGFFDRLSKKFEEISNATEKLKDSFTTLVGLISTDDTDLIGIKPENVKTVTQAFIELRDVIKDIGNLSKNLGINVQEMEKSAANAENNSKTASGAPKTKRTKTVVKNKEDKVITEVEQNQIAGGTGIGDSLMKDAATASGAVEQLNKSVDDLGDLSSKMATMREKFKNIGAGSNITDSTAEEIKEGIPEVEKATQDLTEEVIDTANNGFGIASPSRVFIEIARFCIKGFAIGIEDGQSEITNALKKTFNVDQYLKDMMSSTSQENVFNKLLENITGKYNVTNKETFGENLRTYLEQIVNGLNTDEVLGNIGIGLPTQQVLTDAANNISQYKDSLSDDKASKVLETELKNVNGLSSALLKLGQAFSEAGGDSEKFLEAIKTMSRNDLRDMIKFTGFERSKSASDMRLSDFQNDVYRGYTGAATEKSNYVKSERTPIIDYSTGKEISEQTYSVIERLKKGIEVSAEELAVIPELVRAKTELAQYTEDFINQYEGMDLKSTADLHTEERKALREYIKNIRLISGSYSGIDKEGKEIYNGEVKNEKKASIVLGLPASGKSSTLVNPLSEYYKAKVIDADIVKQLIPEYGGGAGADLVHPESKAINIDYLVETIEKGENLVLPIIGSSTETVTRYMTLLTEAGYELKLFFNDVPKEEATLRNLMRYLETGRLSAQEAIDEAGDLPSQVFEQLKKGDNVSGYIRYDNNVERGKRPNLVDSGGVSETLLGYLQTWRGDRNSEVGSSDSTIKIQAQEVQQLSELLKKRQELLSVLKEYNSEAKQDDGFSSTLKKIREIDQLLNSRYKINLSDPFINNNLSTSTNVDAINEEEQATTQLIAIRRQLEDSGETNEQYADDIMRSAEARKQEINRIREQIEAETQLIGAKKEEADVGETIIASNGVEVVDTKNTSLAPYNNVTASAGSDAVTQVVDEEIKQLERLRLFIEQDIPTAISHKNEAFWKELEVVTMVIDKEIEQFERLKVELETKIAEGVANIDLSGFQQKFNDLFTNIDLSTIQNKILEVISSIDTSTIQSDLQNIFNNVRINFSNENFVFPDFSKAIAESLGQVSFDKVVAGNSPVNAQYIQDIKDIISITDEAKAKTQNIFDSIGGVKIESLQSIENAVSLLETAKTMLNGTNDLDSINKINQSLEYFYNAKNKLYNLGNESGLGISSESFNQILKSIEEIRGEIDAIKQGMSVDLVSEVGVLSELSATLGEVATAIQAKNEEFKEEPGIVSAAVESEIGSLKNLKDSIEEIKDAIIFLNSNIKTMGSEDKGGFFNSIQEILSKSGDLRNFATILSTTKEEIQKTQEAISSGESSGTADTINKAADATDNLGKNIDRVRDKSIIDPQKIHEAVNEIVGLNQDIGDVIRILDTLNEKGEVVARVVQGTKMTAISQLRAEDPDDNNSPTHLTVTGYKQTSNDEKYNIQLEAKRQELDEFEKQLQEAGVRSEELTQKLQKLREELSTTAPHGKFELYNEHLKEFKNDANDAIKKANELSKAIQKEYNDDITTINKLKDARSAYNKTLAANIKDPIKTNAEDVEKANQALIRANKEASKSLEDIVQKYREGKISAEQYFEAFRAMGSEENRLGSEESRREVRNAQNEANTKEYNSYLKTIDAVIDAKSKLNKLEAEEITKGGDAVTNRKIEAQREYEQALERVSEAYLKLVDMEESGKIGETQREAFVDRLAVGSEFWKGNSNSQDAISKAIATQYSKAETAIKKYEEELQKVEKYQNALANGESVAGRLVGATNNMETAKKTAVELLQVLEKINETNTVSGLGVLQTRMSNANTSYDRTKEFDGAEADRGFENAQRGYETLAKNAVAYYKVQQKIASGSAISANDYKLLSRLGEYFELAAKGADNFKNKLGVVEDKLQETNRAEKDFGEKSAEAMSVVVNSALNDVSKKIIELGQKTGPENFKTTFQSLSEEFAALEARIGKIDWNGKSEEDFKQVIANITHVMDKARNLDTGDMYQSVNAVQKETLIRRMAEWQNQNQAAREAIEQIERLKNTLKTVDDQGRLNEVEEEFERIKTAANEAGKTGQTFAQKLKTSFSNLSRYLMSFASFYRIVGTIKQAIGVVRELDTALTEMRKVSDESLQSLKNFQLESFNMADKFGTTAKQIQESTADWLRLGEDFKSAQESAGLSTMLLNVSEFQDINSATESLVAMSQAYKDIDKIDIIDKLNIIGNNFSISTNKLAESLQKSAGTLTVANNTLDEAIALTVAGNQVLQDPLTVGQSLKTISLRLQGTSMQDMQEIGEEVDGLISTQSKLRQTIMDATKVSSNSFKGFDILNNQGNYKSTYEILKGISEIYQEIGEEDKKFGTNRQSLILETIAKGLLWYVEIHMRYIFNCR